jgi:hypothetical protein
MFYCVMSHQGNLIQGVPKCILQFSISFNMIPKQKLYENQKYKRDMIIIAVKPSIYQKFQSIYHHL